ncbi:MAG: serine protease [Pseudomonadota bacterium]|nr:serine protease [Pseudomonadota bacterium]
MNSDRRLRGLWAEDPARIAAVGSELVFHPTLYEPRGEPGIWRLEQWTQFGTTLLSIMFHDPEQQWVDGSAVLIGPGIALAAKHVFDPHLPEIAEGKKAVALASLTDEGLLLWKLQQLVYVDESDVAILRIDLASELPPTPIRPAVLTTRTPAVGEEVMIVGLRSEVPVSRGQPIGANVLAAIGTVSAVYPLERDRAMLPFPCIEISCLTVGGMSGGPAFDRTGKLVGLLTSSNQPEGPSYVSLLWPAFGLKVQSTWLPGIVTLPTNILELARAGFIAVDKLDVVSLEIAGDQALTSYCPWTE